MIVIPVCNLGQYLLVRQFRHKKLLYYINYENSRKKVGFNMYIQRNVIKNLSVLIMYKCNEIRVYE